MSKRALKKYLSDLSKAELEDQITELYDRLKEVKVFYDFVFNPKEDKLMDEAKFKISKEYFPPGKRKAKKRRSVAQNHIKNFLKLGVEGSLIIDLMLYNIEIAQTYTAEKEIPQPSFYKSMLKSFKEAILFIDEQGMYTQFEKRINAIVSTAIDQAWGNKFEFVDVIDARF